MRGLAVAAAIAAAATVPAVAVIVGGTLRAVLARTVRLYGARPAAGPFAARARSLIASFAAGARALPVARRGRGPSARTRVAAVARRHAAHAGRLPGDLLPLAVAERALRRGALGVDVDPGELHVARLLEDEGRRDAVAADVRGPDRHGSSAHDDALVEVDAHGGGVGVHAPHVVVIDVVVTDEVPAVEVVADVSVAQRAGIVPVIERAPAEVAR